MKPHVYLNENNIDIYQGELSKTKATLRIASEHLLTTSFKHYRHIGMFDELLYCGGSCALDEFYIHNFIAHCKKTVYLHLNHNVGYVNVKYCNPLLGLIRTCLWEIYAVVNDRRMSKRSSLRDCQSRKIWAFKNNSLKLIYYK